MNNPEWVIKDIGGMQSGCCNLNFLFQNNKFFIMDNHLAAAWCWSQKLDSNQKYNFLHIDMHYDLAERCIEKYLEALDSVNLFQISIDALLSLKVDLPDDSLPVFIWDNYIVIFIKSFPNIFAESFFATHRKPSEKIPRWYEFNEISRPCLLENFPISKVRSLNGKKWVLNIDIDYFFEYKDGEYVQSLDDLYIRELCVLIQDNICEIAVITIALSPECCGGWENSTRIANIFSSYFDLGFSVKARRSDLN